MIGGVEESSHLEKPDFEAGGLGEMFCVVAKNFLFSFSGRSLSLGLARAGFLKT